MDPAPLCVAFNQDQGCFACGMDDGFRIFNVEPFKETFRRADFKGGIGIVEMLFRCNLLALVGGGRNPKFPPNIVKIWDDHQGRAIGELMFRSKVESVRLRRDRVVVQRPQATGPNFYSAESTGSSTLSPPPEAPPAVLLTLPPLPPGLVALCPDAAVVLACPGVTKGNVRVELYDLRKSQLIPAHESELAALALNMQASVPVLLVLVRKQSPRLLSSVGFGLYLHGCKGTRLATASDKGTLIRVFDCQTGERLYELRRGMDRALIHSIAFSRAGSSQYLACSSDKGTAHVFALTASRKKADEEQPRDDGSMNNKTSSFSILRKILPGVPKYVESEWSFAQIHGLEPNTVIAFGQEPGTIVVVGSDGSFLTTNFSAGGECEKLQSARFLRSPLEEIASSDGDIPPPTTIDAQPTSE